MLLLIKAEIEVMCMERIGRSLDSFVWPENDDMEWNSYDAIVCHINPANPETRQTFAVTKDNFKKIFFVDG